MNLGGLDCATTSGLTVLKGRVFTATTFKAPVKKRFLERDEGQKLDANHEGAIGRAFEDFFTLWLIQNEIGHMGIEAPLPSNNTRTKTEIDTSSNWAGKSIKKTKVAGTSLSSVFRSYGLEFLAASVCSRLNIPVTFINQSEWRKAFLGHGRPPDAKKLAKKECERLNIAVTSLDAAESVGVCWYLNQHLNPYGTRGNDLFGQPASASIPKSNAHAKAEALFQKPASQEALSQ